MIARLRTALFGGRVFSLGLAAGLVAFGLAAGVAGFMILEGYSFGEALYMTVITISTVGYGEVRPLSPEGRGFTTILIAVNVGIFAYSISAFTYFLAEGDFFRRMHERDVTRRIALLRNHVILGGYGRHGREAVIHLVRHGIPFLVVETNDEVLEELRREGHPCLADDATDDEVLQRTGIERARALISALPEDTENVYTVLAARQMNPRLTIIARASRHRSGHRLELAGADHVVLPEQIGGFYMATLVTQPGTVDFFQFITDERMSDFRFEEASCDTLPMNMRDRSIRELKIRPATGASIIGLRLRDGSFTVNPDPDARLEPGTRILVVGNEGQIRAFRELVGAAPEAGMRS